MNQKPKLMILGTHHLANPGRDIINLEADDVMLPKRQREIRQLVALLGQFHNHYLNKSGWVKCGKEKGAVSYSWF